jgi:SAM-dependent methyltransferase
MTVEEHYANHLGDFYSWTVGDFVSKQAEQKTLFESLKIFPSGNRIAIDLGCGHGLQSVSLAQLGYEVKAIDFNPQLIGELRINASGLPIEIFQDDILHLSNYADPYPELIVCMGDTITHLNSKEEILGLITDCYSALAKGGKLVLSFRDYSNELTDTHRFIPVKSDDCRILTCFLEYFPETVRVTDLLHEKSTAGWIQKTSSYQKVRLSETDIIRMLEGTGLTIAFNQLINRLRVVVASK